ncbi:MAG: hypothetical protein KAV42_02105 [Candidatus Krumholzibacteria bacterium]|nr:hypothetical protein [Candidatus Krumholzibacteria bacterium]
MTALKTRALLVLTAIAILVFISQSAFGAAASVKKSVTPMEDGRYLIKLKVTSAGSDIYGLRIIDPEASIINIYAPRGWCAITDGEDFLARTFNLPLKSGRPVEFIIHSSTDKINYTWSVSGKMKELGKPETL